MYRFVELSQVQAR